MQAARFERNDEVGGSLIESMMTILVLGIVMTGLASTLVTSMRTQLRSEREVAATSLQNEVLEHLRSVPWDAVALYDDEVAAAGITPPANTVGRPAPASAAHRDPNVPLPVWIATRDGVDYNMSLSTTWVDADGDGNPDTKRIVTTATWMNADGVQQTSTLLGERAPASAELPGTRTMRVLRFDVTPDPAPLTVNGMPLYPMKVSVRLTEGVTSAKVSFKALTAPLLGTTATVNVTLAGGEVDPAGGFVTWTGTFPSTVVMLNGDLDVTFTGSNALTAVVSAVETVTFTGGPYNPVVPPPPVPTPNAALPVVAFTTVAPLTATLCNVSLVQPALSKAFTVQALTTGLDGSDSVTMTYPYWSKASLPGPPDQVGTVSATFVGGDRSAGIFRASIPAGAAEFRNGGSIQIVVQGNRNSDLANATHTMTPVVVGVC